MIAGWPPLSKKDWPEDEARFVAEAALVRDRLRQKQLEAEKTHAAELRSTKARLHRAIQLVEESGVGESATDLVEILWHSPSRYEKDLSQEPLVVQGLDGGEIADSQKSSPSGRWLGWTEGNQHYRLELTVTSNFMKDEIEFGHLRLTCDGTLVLDLDVSQRIGGDYSQWRVFGVSAFRGGPWMVRLNELAGCARIVRDEQRRQTDKKYYIDKAKNIELD